MFAEGYDFAAFPVNISDTDGHIFLNFNIPVVI